MFLQTPSDIADLLYEGNLTFEREELNRLLPTRGDTSVPSPTVSIGLPVWWNLADLIREQGKPLPPELSLLMEEADFYLVRLACSFRPTRASWIEWARFAVYLRAKSSGADPIAFDLHPREVQNEITTEIKVAISPSLKFIEIVEASLGRVDFGIQYQRLEPVIIGTGAQEPTPGWDFSRSRRHDIQGAKFLHLIVKRPKGIEAVETGFDLRAQVRIRQGILRASLPEEARAHLTSVMCY